MAETINTAEVAISSTAWFCGKAQGLWSLRT